MGKAVFPHCESQVHVNKVMWGCMLSVCGLAMMSPPRHCLHVCFLGRTLDFETDEHCLCMCNHGGLVLKYMNDSEQSEILSFK